MKRVLLLLVAAAMLIAATPEGVVADLASDGYYIDSGSNVSEQAVSDAVFEARSSGGELYIVVLSEEPPGGAPTFSDAVLEQLGGGYVVTVAPESVGWAGDGSFWTRSEMQEAVAASLDGGSDTEVVEIFSAALNGGGAAPDSGGGFTLGGWNLFWILLIGGAVLVAWSMFQSRSRASSRTAGRLEQVKKIAREKLDEVANDVLDMEDEVTLSDNSEIKEHYARASAIYARAIEQTDRAGTLQDMLQVSDDLDLAIWELDCAEALLDGKEKPPKPEPKKDIQTLPDSPPPEPAASGYDRRPARQTSGGSDMATMLLTMMAMRGMGRRGGFPGGFSGRGFPGGMSGGGRRSGRMGGGGGRMGGGGRRMGGGGRRG